MRKLLYSLLILGLMSCDNDKQSDGSKNSGEYVKETKVDYYPDGKIKLEGNTVNGKAHGTWKYYYENGFLWSEGKFRHGIRDGYSIVYYENGKKHLQGQYDEGKQVGWWSAWNEDGTFADSINVEKPLTGRDSLLIGLK